MRQTIVVLLALSGLLVACGNGTSTNPCGGETDLEGLPGAACGQCGMLACEGTDALVCQDPGQNACGGCSALTGELGEACGECGVLVCQGTDFLECDDPGAAACGPIALEPPDGYSSSQALGINNHGVVVGRVFNVDNGTETDRRAFVWDRTSGTRLLGSTNTNSGAWAINELGMVSGFSLGDNEPRQATLWNSAGNTATTLGTLGSGTSAWGYGLNRNGDVVGHADVVRVDEWDLTVFHGFKYNAQTGIVDLGTLTEEGEEAAHGFSIAYSINNNGECVGISHGDSWHYLPFFHSEATGMLSLEIDSAFAPAHPNGPEWYATIINDSGLIGGHVLTEARASLPYYWTNRSATPTALDMPNEFPYGEIYGVNSVGKMVGIMWSSTAEDATERAFIFDSQNGVMDLNDMIGAELGWTLKFAREINDSGQIVGAGLLNGSSRGFVLPPAAYGG